LSASITSGLSFPDNSKKWIFHFQFPVIPISRGRLAIDVIQNLHQFFEGNIGLNITA
jgi:hypothetical protein